MAGIIAGNFLPIDAEVLPVVVTASSVIVGVMAGFTMRYHQSLDRFRGKKVFRFGHHQDRLLYYGVAFGALAARIRQAWEETLPSDPARRAEVTRDSSDQIVQLIESLEKFSQMSSEAPPDFETVDKMVPKSSLDALATCMRKVREILSVQPCLDRFKNEIMASTDPGRSVVARESEKEMEYAIYKLGMGFENDWRAPDFWIERIRDCRITLDRMGTAGKYAYALEKPLLSRLIMMLSFMALFGVFLPVATMMIGSLAGTYVPYLSAISVAGLFSYLAAVLRWIHLRASTEKIGRF